MSSGETRAEPRELDADEAEFEIDLSAFGRNASAIATARALALYDTSTSDINQSENSFNVETPNKAHNISKQHDSNSTRTVVPRHSPPPPPRPHSIPYNNKGPSSSTDGLNTSPDAPISSTYSQTGSQHGLTPTKPPQIAYENDTTPHTTPQASKNVLSKQSVSSTDAQIAQTSYHNASSSENEVNQSTTNVVPGTKTPQTGTNGSNTSFKVRTQRGRPTPPPPPPGMAMSSTKNPTVSTTATSNHVSNTRLDASGSPTRLNEGVSPTEPLVGDTVAATNTQSDSNNKHEMETSIEQDQTGPRSKRHISLKSVASSSSSSSSCSHACDLRNEGPTPPPKPRDGVYLQRRTSIAIGAKPPRPTSPPPRSAIQHRNGDVGTRRLTEPSLRQLDPRTSPTGSDVGPSSLTRSSSALPSGQHSFVRSSGDEEISMTRFKGSFDHAISSNERFVVENTRIFFSEHDDTLTERQNLAPIAAEHIPAATTNAVTSGETDTKFGQTDPPDTPSSSSNHDEHSRRTFTRIQSSPVCRNKPPPPPSTHHLSSAPTSNTKPPLPPSTHHLSSGPPSNTKPLPPPSTHQQSSAPPSNTKPSPPSSTHEQSTILSNSFHCTADKQHDISQSTTREIDSSRQTSQQSLMASNTLYSKSDQIQEHHSSRQHHHTHNQVELTHQRGPQPHPSTSGSGRSSISSEGNNVSEKQSYPAAIDRMEAWARKRQERLDAERQKAQDEKNAQENCTFQPNLQLTKNANKKYLGTSHKPVLQRMDDWQKQKDRRQHKLYQQQKMEDNAPEDTHVSRVSDAHNWTNKTPMQQARRKTAVVSSHTRASNAFLLSLGSPNTKKSPSQMYHTDTNNSTKNMNSREMSESKTTKPPVKKLSPEKRAALAKRRKKDIQTFLQRQARAREEARAKQDIPCTTGKNYTGKVTKPVEFKLSYKKKHNNKESDSNPNINRSFNVSNPSIPANRIRPRNHRPISKEPQMYKETQNTSSKLQKSNRQRNETYTPSSYKMTKELQVGSAWSRYAPDVGVTLQSDVELEETTMFTNNNHTSTRSTPEQATNIRTTTIDHGTRLEQTNVTTNTANYDTANYGTIPDEISITTAANHDHGSTVSSTRNATNSHAPPLYVNPSTDTTRNSETMHQKSMLPSKILHSVENGHRNIPRPASLSSNQTMSTEQASAAVQSLISSLNSSNNYGSNVSQEPRPDTNALSLLAQIQQQLATSSNNVDNSYMATSRRSTSPQNNTSFLINTSSNSGIDISQPYAAAARALHTAYTNEYNTGTDEELSLKDLRDEVSRVRMELQRQRAFM